MTANLNSRRLPWTVPVILAVFLAAVSGTWAWFHVGPVPETSLNRLWLTARTNLSGCGWLPEQISADAAQILEADRLVNGRLILTNQATEAVYSVFTADWVATESKPLNVARHTPDVCWVGAGWRPINLGAPQQVFVRVASPAAPRSEETLQSLPFECRTFQSPNSARVELVIWCALLNGAPVAEGRRWRVEDDSAVDPLLRLQNSARRSALSQFLQGVQRRVPGNRTKQFLRLSMPSHTDANINEAVRELTTFAEKVFAAELLMARSHSHRSLAAFAARGK